MIVRHMTKEDVNAVFSNPWPLGVEEALTFGSSFEATRELFLSRVGKPWSTAFCNENDCFAVIIMEPTGDMIWQTQFMTQEEGFKKNGLSLTRWLKKVSDRIVNEYSGGKAKIKLTTVSDSDFKWFEVLGFKLIGTDGFIDTYIKER